MLPWRRSKFVLVEKESKWEGKSLVAGLTYSSLISSLVRGCPHLLPECSFHRIGGMFRTKRQKVQLTREDPTYTVWYLGSAVTLSAKGEGCTDEAVGKIWARSEGGGSSNKMRLTVGPHGIRMSQPEERSKKNGHMYLLSRITYCGADSRHPRILAWVYRHQVRNKAVVLRCHAALVSKPEKAKAIASLLDQTSTSAFNEFKRLKRQDDDRHRQQQLLGDAIVPLVPLRKLLNRHCPYRSKSTPRLSSIPEDVVGEEAAEETGEGEGVGEGVGVGEQLGRSTSLVDASKLHGCKAIGRSGNSDGIGTHPRPLAGNTEVTMAGLLSGQCTDSHSPQPSSV